MVEGRRCHGVVGRVLFKLYRNGCGVLFRVGRRVLFRVGSRVLCMIVRRAPLRVVRRVLFMNGRKMFGRRERAGLVFVQYQDVYFYTGMAERFLYCSSLCERGARRLGPGRGEEEGRIQVTWQREYGRGD